MFNRNSLVAVLSAAGLMALSGAALAQVVVSAAPRCREAV